MVLCLLSKEKEKEVMELDEWGDGEYLGGDEGGKTVIKIIKMYCLKKLFLMKKVKKKKFL